MPSCLPSPGGQGVAIVVNDSADSGRGGAGVRVLRQRLPKARIIELDEGDDLETALETAARGAAVLGVSGGDGTVNTAAGVAAAHHLPLAVAPGGTLNHFARALGLASATDTAAAIEAGRLESVDVGDIAGRPFVNTASFGGYPELVDTRERWEGRIGKWPAMLLAVVRVLRTEEPVRVLLDGAERRVWIVFAGNCQYQGSGFAPRHRPRLDDGELDIRVVDASRRLARTRLVAAVMTGTLGRCRVYEQRLATQLRVRSLQGPLRLARDGETFDGPVEFTISKRAEPIEVLAPASSERA